MRLPVASFVLVVVAAVVASLGGFLVRTGVRAQEAPAEAPVETSVTVTVRAPDGSVPASAVVRVARASGTVDVVPVVEGVARVPFGARESRVHLMAQAGDGADLRVSRIIPVRPDRISVILHLGRTERLRVTIVDRVSGRPIVGARVRALGTEGIRAFHPAGWMTGEDGAVELVCATDEPWPFLTASAAGYFDERRQLGDRASDASAPTIGLTPHASLTATVRSPDGAPVVGARVRVLDTALYTTRWWGPLLSAGIPFDRGGETGVTGADGTCRIDGIRPMVTWRDPRPGDGVFIAIASAPGFAAWSQTPAFEFAGSPPRANVEIPLRRPATLDVMLRGPEGRTVEAARVRRGILVDSDPEFVRQHRARCMLSTAWPGPVAGESSPGSHRFTDLPPGPQWVEICADGFVPMLHSWNLEEGATRTETVSLVPAVPARVRVLDDRGEPVAGAEVWIDADDAVLASVSEGLTHVPSNGRTGPDGWFSTPGGPWALTVRIEDPRYVVPAPGRLNLPERRTDQNALEARITRLAGARARLVPPEGAPLPSDVVVRTVPMSRSLVVQGRDIEIPKAAPVAGATVLCVAGYVPVEIGSRLRPGETVDLGDIVLDPGVTLRGRVVARDGLPVEGALVVLVQRDSAVDPQTRTAADGTFAVPHATAGENDVRVIHPVGTRRDFRVRGDAAAELVLHGDE